MFEPLHGQSPLHIGGLAVCGVFLATWLHEIGHAVAGHLAGYRITSLGTGFGKPLLRFRLGTTVLYVSLRKPFQGITTSVSDSWPRARWGKVALLAGGLIANAMAAGACGIMMALLPQVPTWLSVFFWINVGFVLLSLIPATVTPGGLALQTDAGQILSLIRGKTKSYNTLPKIGDMSRYLGFLDAIGDEYGGFHYRTHLASALVDIGNANRALDLLEEADPSIYDETSQMGVLFRVVRGSARMAAGREEEALADLESTRPFLEEAGAPDMHPHIGQLLAQRRLATDDVDEALAALDGCKVHGEEEPAQARLLRARIAIEKEDLEAAGTILDTTRALGPEDRLVSMALRGRLDLLRDNREEALELLRQGFTQFLRNLARLQLREDREAYTKKHALLRQTLGDALRSAGRTEDAGKAESAFSRAMNAPVAREALFSMPGLVSLAGALISLGMVGLAFRSLANVEDDTIRLLMTAALLAAFSLVFAANALRLPRVSRLFPGLAAALSVLSFVIILSFMSTLYLSRRHILRETLELDRNGDGIPDQVLVIEEGVRRRAEIDSDFDGTIDQWVSYRNGMVHAVAVDTDGDGRPDTWR